MTSPVQEHKHHPIDTVPKALPYLQEHQGSDCSRLFFSFLETFAKGVRRDAQGNETPHSFTVLDRELSRCNERVINNLMKRSLEKAFEVRVATFADFTHPLYVMNARLFGIPDKNRGNQTDVASILHYQKNRINPSSFKPLDYFSQSDETQGFVAAQFEIPMGDTQVLAAEYLCPCKIADTWETSVTELVQDEPTVQIRRMDKKYIGASLAHIATLFERIVKPAKPYTAEALTKDLAELIYKWTFTSPFEDECGEFTELLQTTLASLHGFQLRVRDQEKIHEKALGTPFFPTFLKKYGQIVQISK